MSKKKDPDFEGFDDQEIELDIGQDAKDQSLEKEQPALSHASYQELEDQLTAAEKKADAMGEKALRIQAELDNMRRRHERDLAHAHKYSLEKFALELLAVMDNLERGLAQMTSKEDRVGIELTLKQLQSVFDKFGIKAVDPKGKPFDPNQHEAMATIASDQAPGTVVDVLQKGYLLQDRLLRPALVAVAKKE